MALQGVCGWSRTVKEGCSESEIVRRAMAVKIHGQLQGDNMIRFLLVLRSTLEGENNLCKD